MVGTRDLKSLDHIDYAGSSPASGTKNKGKKVLALVFVLQYIVFRTCM